MCRSYGRGGLCGGGVVAVFGFGCVCVDCVGHWWWDLGLIVLIWVCSDWFLDLGLIWIGLLTRFMGLIC